MTKFICFSALHHLAALKKQNKQPNKKKQLFKKKHCDQHQKQTHQQEQV